LNACEEIAEDINLGRKYFKIIPDLFGLHINRHVIFFRRIDSDYVEIERILHEGMNYKRRE
jgi:toxin ParE1/3/4